MKRTWILICLFAILLAACAPASSGSVEGALKVGGGTIEQSYTRADLEVMPTTEAAFKDVNYVGVSMPALLQEAGFDPTAIQAVKAVAADGYAVNYEAAIFTREDVIVAYAQADGDLSEEDGSFRMVIPDGEGKLNLRMLTEVVVIP